MNSIHPASALRALSLVACLSAIALPARSAPLVNDTFSDGNRTTAPTWYWVTGVGASNRVDTVASNTWTVGTATANAGSGYIVTYFTPTTLAIDESITLSFNFTYAENSTSAGNQLRFGLFDSGASRISADSLGTTSLAAFNGDLGYSVFYTLPTTTGTSGYSVKERTGTHDTLWSTTALATTLTGPTNSAVSAAGTSYSASFVISRTDSDTLTISALVNGQLIETFDTTPTTFTFDMLSIYAGGANGTLSLGNISVTSTVPEPQTYALFAGLAGLGVVACTRRR